MDDDQIMIEGRPLKLNRPAMEKWITLFNACEITPDDLSLWIDTHVIMTPNEFIVRMQEDPIPEDVLLLLALRPDAAALVAKLTGMAEQRDDDLGVLIERCFGHN